MKDHKMNTTPRTQDAAAISAQIAAEARAVIIARDNDAFRKTVIGGQNTIAGVVVHSNGLDALGFVTTARAYLAVRAFRSFTEDNDPYGEHEFGSIEVDGHTVFWKIDLYSDASCSWGSDDPTDPAQVYRVLTLYLAHEH